MIKVTCQGPCMKYELFKIMSFRHKKLSFWTDRLKTFVTQIMSNGIFKSPVHRVVTNTKKERLSVALDYSVAPEKEIEPSAQLVNEKRPGLYRKVKVKDYIATYYNHFFQGEMVIDTIKI